MKTSALNLVAALWAGIFCVPPNLSGQEASKEQAHPDLKYNIYRYPGGEDIVIVSKAELELRSSGGNFVFSYSVRDGAVRYFGNLHGTAEAFYLKIVGEGLQREDGRMYFDPPAYDRAMDWLRSLFSPDRVYTGTIKMQTLAVFAGGTYKFTLRFSSFDKATGRLVAITRGVGERQEQQMTGQFKGYYWNLKNARGAEWELAYFNEADGPKFKGTLIADIGSGTIEIPIGVSTRAITSSTEPSSNPAQPGDRKGRGLSVEQRMERMTEELKLTDEQKPKVKAVLEDSQKQRQELRGDSSLSQEDRRGKMEGIMDKENKKLKDILTADQFTKYEKIRAEMRQGGRGGQKKDADTKKD